MNRDEFYTCIWKNSTDNRSCKKVNGWVDKKREIGFYKESNQSIWRDAWFAIDLRSGAAFAEADTLKEVQIKAKERWKKLSEVRANDGAKYYKALCVEFSGMLKQEADNPELGGDT